MTEQQTKKTRHVGLFLFLALQGVFLIWVILGAKGGHGTAVDCHGLSPADCKSLKDARDTGTAIGVTMVIVVWAAVDIVIGITYGLYRLIKR